MIYKKPLPSQEKLQHLFSYDSETGNLSWRIKSAQRIVIGRPIGNKTVSRMSTVKIDGEFYYLAPIIWKLVTGEEPLEIDHIDRNYHNDRLSNLRAANRSINNKNRMMTRDSLGRFA